jgi:rare lipoprotein A
MTSSLDGLPENLNVGIMEIMKRVGLVFPPLVLLIILSGCRARVDYFPEGNVQTGVASWYGEEFHGKSTSSHEIYDMNDLTAAHNTLPLGTYVMVTNLRNGQSVVVRINDRGPFVKNRVIDLSYAAARSIDLVGPGTAPVKIEVLRDLSPPMTARKFSVQVGSFASRLNAAALERKLKKNFAGVYIALYKTPTQTYFRVRIKAGSREDARSIAENLAARGYTAIVFEEQ